MIRSAIYRFKYLLAAILCFVFAFLLESNVNFSKDKTISNFQKVLHKKEKILKNKVDELALIAEQQSYDSLFLSHHRLNVDLFNNEGLILLIYESDTLRYWTNNSMAVENYLQQVCLDDKIAQLKNGWFEVLKMPSKKTGVKTVVGLLLIKNEYPYQNKYLNNEYQHNFSVSKEVLISKTSSKYGLPVFTSDKNTLCYFIFPGDYVEDTFIKFMVLLLYSAGLFFSLLIVRSECEFLIEKKHPVQGLLLFVIALTALRFLTIYIPFPEIIYKQPLFQPDIFGDATSFWLPSLGDLLINTVLIFYTVWFAVKNTGQGKEWKAINKWKGIMMFPLLLILLLLSRLVNDLFVGLIKNSNIPFYINNLFALNIYSFIALFIIALLLFSYFLLVEKTVTLIVSGIKDKRRLFLYAAIATAVFTVYSHLIGTYDLITILWPAALLGYMLIIKMRHSLYNFAKVVVLMFIFTFYAVHTLKKFRDMKEMDGRKLYIEKLAAEQDPLAEHLFAGIEKEIKKDTLLFTSYKKEPTDFGKNFVQKYFGGFWEKFDIRVSLFDTLCRPLFNGSHQNRDNHQYFEETISAIGFPTESENCYYIDIPDGKTFYIVRIPLFADPSEHQLKGTLYIEMESRPLSEEIGFPELLLDREFSLNKALANYSYAKYKDGELLTRFGKYTYHVNTSMFPEGKKTIFDFNEGGYNHLLYGPDETSLLVLSLKNEGLLDQFTTFSYLFTYFSLILIIAIAVKQITFGVFLSQVSFKNRIQLLLVMLILVSLVLFGTGTIYYITRQYEEKNEEIVREKLQSVLLEVEAKLSSEKELTANLKEYAEFVMKKFSNVFFTDINLYDLNGNLYASSRFKVFEEGLTSRKMNSEAYKNMHVLRKTEFIHNENIGKLNYLSAYVPFKNNEGKLMAYLNLPYFAKQSELEKEISAFLVALVNVYVLLFGFSIIIAIFISNYLTRPLRLLQDKIGKTKLGKVNEPIEWKQQDEIGNLIDEYNRMIQELAKSAELLARSERESAWREMAKQVAHEIKNPLTPMKLSIQHLQRLINDKSPGIEEKIKKLSDTLIEQIETLSSIANAFSNFAKMPKAQNEKLNITVVLNSAIQLFQENENATIHFISSEEPMWVFADKEQLLRVFNNLIKNALQAIPENIEGKITIETIKKDNDIVVSVKDNGNGISEEAMEKIFLPSFTTKTGGMGLGLAMVKNIVEGCNGKIWFQTTKNLGTTFFVSIPELRTEG